MQRWYVDGTVECFTGSHALLASFAILVLMVCLVLIVIVTVIVVGKVEVLYYNIKATCTNAHISYY